ncbi:hypothetical protein LCGC14_2347700, partial [marine sediment metagenome]
LADGSVSNAELQRLDGVTSDVQGQIDAKMPLAGGTFSGIVNFQKTASLLDKVSVYRNGSQTIPSGPWIRVEFNAEVFDTAGHFANYRFTAAVGGYYQVAFTALMNDIIINKRAIAGIFKDGALVADGRVASYVTSLQLHMSLSKLVYLAVNSYIEGYVYQDTGSDRILSGLRHQTFMTIMGPF